MTGPKRHLKYLGVRKRTIDLYKREVSLFFDYLSFHNIKVPTSMETLDLEIGEYINHLYQEGEAVSRAGWLLSGFRRLYPRTRRELCLAQQWYTNWTREHVPLRAVPMPWKVLLSLVGLCCHEDWPHLAICLLIGFTFFLRTQEVLSLHADDIEVSLPDQSVVIRLHRTKTSKQHLQALTISDLTLAKLLTHLLPPLSSSRLWPWSTTYFRRCFTSLCTFFHLESIGFVPYSLRRGGATHFYVALQALDFVMVQGRWKDQRTCRLYVDDARAMLVNFRLPPASIPLLRHFRSFLIHGSLRKL